MIAVTNGLTMADHELLQESVGNRYPVTLSLGVATGTSPVQALSDATTVVQDAGSAQDEDRRSVSRDGLSTILTGPTTTSR